MKHLGILLAGVLLAGCLSVVVSSQPDEGSPLYQLPAGARLILRQQVQVPAGRSQIYFQNGRATDWQPVNIYLPHCVLAVKPADDSAAQTLQPDEFTVARSHTERFFKRVDAPAPRSLIRAAGLDVTWIGAGDFDRGGNMDYEVVAVIMELGSQRQPNVTSMTCVDWGLPQDAVHITVRKMRAALGSFFDIRKPPEK